MPLTCLIVAHDPWFIQLIRLFADEFGFQTIQSCDGADILPAIQFISSNLPGKLNYHEIVNKVREDQRSGNLVILFIHPQALALDQKMVRLIDGELNEPFSYDAFCSALWKTGFTGYSMEIKK
jgi:hypothetical protein